MANLTQHDCNVIAKKIDTEPRNAWTTELREQEVAAFLTQLAVEGQVASATQNQALNALVFLYRNVLDRPLGDCTGIVPAKRSQRVPVVFTAAEVAGILRKLEGSIG